MTFKDHFSGHANTYKSGRPHYPQALFEDIIKLVKHHDTVWDCATGNGQAAKDLAKYFKYVIATDASEQQISNADHLDNIEYKVAPAENVPLADHSVDLVTVAQALHWFNFENFFKEVKRVLKNPGVFCAWTYVLLTTENNSINDIITEYYHNIVGQYWAPERRYVESKYNEIDFPFNFVESKEYAILLDWSYLELLNYFSTWSSTQKYIRENNENPVETWLKPKFEQHIKNLNDIVKVNIPLYLKICLHGD